MLYSYTRVGKGGFQSKQFVIDDVQLLEPELCTIVMTDRHKKMGAHQIRFAL